MMDSKKKNALIIVDPQYDFCKNGPLEIPNAEEVFPIINHIRKKITFDNVYITGDWHPANHVSFASSHEGKKPFENILLPNGRTQELWPDHCLKEQPGAQFHKDLHRDNTEIIIRKGTLADVESYGGFGTKPEETGLEKSLKSKAVEKIFILGLALDFCVKTTAIEGKNAGLVFYFFFFRLN